jgi:hypothetical protein
MPTAVQDRIEQESDRDDHSELLEATLDAATHQVSEQVALDVSKDHSERVVGLRGEDVEPALLDASAEMIVAEVAAEVGGQEPVHPTAEVAIGAGPERQMEVIGYEAIGDDQHAHAEGRLGHHLEEGVVVAVSVEDGGARVAAVQDVIAIPGGRGPSGAGHGKNSLCRVEEGHTDIILSSLRKTRQE